MVGMFIEVIVVEVISSLVGLSLFSSRFIASGPCWGVMLKNLLLATSTDIDGG